MIYLCIIISKTNNNYNIHLSSNGRVRCTYRLPVVQYIVIRSGIHYISKSRVFNIKFTSKSCECACVWYIRRTGHRTDPKV